jgi:hypothetical protein
MLAAFHDYHSLLTNLKNAFDSLKSVYSSIVYRHMQIV